MLAVYAYICDCLCMHCSGLEIFWGFQKIAPGWCGSPLPLCADSCVVVLCCIK
jgi:hypothetical protein